MASFMTSAIICNTASCHLSAPEISSSERGLGSVFVLAEHRGHKSPFSSIYDCSEY